MQRDASIDPPASVALRYIPWPVGVGFAAEMPSVDGEPALQLPEGPSVDMVWTWFPDGKDRCEVLRADEKMRDKLRLIRLNFVGVLESLGAITRERALEIVSEPLVEPR